MNKQTQKVHGNKINTNKIFVFKKCKANQIGKHEIETLRNKGFNFKVKRNRNSLQNQNRIILIKIYWQERAYIFTKKRERAYICKLRFRTNSIHTMHHLNFSNAFCLLYDSQCYSVPIIKWTIGYYTLIRYLNIEMLQEWLHTNKQISINFSVSLLYAMHRMMRSRGFPM